MADMEKKERQTAVRRRRRSPVRGPLPFTVEDVREYVMKHTETEEKYRKFLHSIGIRYRENGEVYVVPV